MLFGKLDKAMGELPREHDRAAPHLLKDVAGGFTTHQHLLPVTFTSDEIQHRAASIGKSVLAIRLHEVPQ